MKYSNITASLRKAAAVAAVLFFTIASAPAEQPDRAWADETLRTMSLREKIAQLVQIRVTGRFVNRRSPEFAAVKDLIQRERVGGVVLFAGNVYESAVLLNELQAASRLPLLVSADFERGAALRIDDTTSFPWTMALGAAGSEDLAFQQGLVTAREARALGVHWIFAPVMDVNNNPENPVINIRSFGEDPLLVARLGSAFIRGAKKGSVLATAKHFPGHGDTSTDSHISLPVVQADLDRLESVEFVPFRRAVEAGVDSIMTAHVSVPKITSDAQAPATLSTDISTGLLRNILKFKGILVTDALEMGGITNSYWCGLAAVRALQAGADVLLLPTNAVVAVNEVERAVRRGEIARSRIDDSARKILQAKARLRLHLNRTVPIQRIGDIVASPESVKLAQTIADHSITAVQDEISLLPVNPAADPKIFSLTLATGLESSPAAVFQAQMRRRFPSLRTAWGNSRITAEMMEDIEGEIAAADLIVCATVARLVVGQETAPVPESHRRIFQKISESRKPVVWVIFGNPYILSSFPQVGTCLCAFSYSDVSQTAAAKALAGEIPIQGKMPVSIPGYCRAGDGLRVAKLEMKLKRDPPAASAEAAEVSEKIRVMLDSAISGRLFPGARILAGLKGKVLLDVAAGKTAFSAGAVDVSADTVYHLGSLSTLAAAAAALMAAESGSLNLKDPVLNYLPERKGKIDASLRVLDLWRPASGGLNSEDDLTARGGLLEEIVSRASGLRFRRYFTHRFLAPLGMQNSFYDAPPNEFRGSVVPSQASRRGWFARAHDLASFAQMLLNKGVYDHRRFLSPASVNLFTGSEGAWSRPDSSERASRLFSASAFGRSALNGSSLWIDPDRQLFIIFLTNAPEGMREQIEEAQGVIHELILSRAAGNE
jgi:beta-glucosidase-like glycosyl hydrolase/CubicO group peptidase (beta-lactamase class C family)